MSRLLIAALFMSVLAGDAALNVSGEGVLLDAYALADSGDVTVTLFDSTQCHYLILRYNAAGGWFIDERIELPAWSGGLPASSLTEVCGGRLHIWLSWDERGQVLHYAWDLPIDEIQKLHLPLVCRGR